MLAYRMCVFLFKQKTAYEMRISDWSSDVCSSDIAAFTAKFTDIQLQATGITAASGLPGVDSTNAPSNTALSINAGSARAKGVEVDGIVSPTRDRKSVVEGKSVAGRVDIGGRRINKKRITT